jgi:predicted secreted protein
VLRNIDKSHDGTTVAANVGDTLRLQLPDNAAGGYRWNITSRDDRLLTMDEERNIHRSGEIGAGSIAEWTMTVRAPGKTKLEAIRWRPFEGERSIIDKIALAIEIEH